MEAAAKACVIVFAKAPVEGQVKTRLIPAIGAAAAAQLHCAMVCRAVETATKAGLGRVELCCAPDERHDFFAACASKYEIVLTRQSGGDLGARMFDALRRGLQAHTRVLLIGADCPALTVEDLHDAAAALARHDLVVAPAEDGGYVLIGATHADMRLFDGIEWSGPNVMHDTRHHASYMGWRMKELRTLWDVDLPADLQRLTTTGISVSLG